MIQVGAVFPGARADRAIRVGIASGSASLFAKFFPPSFLTSQSTAAHITGYDWNRNSEAVPLKSSTL
jgi:hypothetical protein